jgi:hypothetical protein
VRGFSVEDAEIYSGAPWSKISDHAALSAHLHIADVRRSGPPSAGSCPEPSPGP